MNKTSSNLFQVNQKSNIHDLAVELLERQPDTHFMTLLELYRNCQLDPDSAQKMISAFTESIKHLGPANKLMSKHLLTATVNHLRTQF